MLHTFVCMVLKTFHEVRGCMIVTQRLLAGRIEVGVYYGSLLGKQLLEIVILKLVLVVHNRSE